MDDLDPDIFNDFTAIKARNPGLKAIVAIGGWAFTDPGVTQTVFSELVSLAENRKIFIENLMGFMRKYAFDGVDFDLGDDAEIFNQKIDFVNDLGLGVPGTILQMPEGCGPGNRKFTHTLDNTYILKIVDETWHSPLHNWRLLAQAEGNFHIKTSFGFTLILPFPGASFSILGIATIGPAVHLKGRVEAGLQLTAVMETRVDVASWEFKQTLPHTSIQQPEFYAGISANRNVEVYAIAVIGFGAKFDDYWKLGGNAIASVVAEGWIEAKAHSAFTPEGNCPFT
ncbi:hypothetical protein E0Z10_g9907 [Xylaria hypoxylon]|uniref:GH18 domain-containing protein n=1 Tax=Xylaria hypoxylon TaxID=37992 RepID=A0A4Z0YHU8_9PEZI|nr:hypothetical protein E0Z10_g9907 [Xylaria hypoxylon]